MEQLVVLVDSIVTLVLGLLACFSVYGCSLIISKAGLSSREMDIVQLFAVLLNSALIITLVVTWSLSH